MWKVALLCIVVSCCPAVSAHAQPQPAADAAVQAPAAAAEARLAPASPSPPAADSGSVGRPWWESSGWWLVIGVAFVGLVSVALAIFTARLWKATSDLVKATAAAGRREHRAYVALDEIFFEEAGDTAPGVHRLRIRNYGQTPASGMTVWCERATHLPQAGVTPYYDTPVVDHHLLHPVQAYTVTLAAAPLYRIGKPGFFTYGRIVYSDIHGTWWTTQFCFRYEGEGRFVPHGEYNAEEGPFDKKPV